jgi:CRP-like cAMP-binding protein
MDAVADIFKIFESNHPEDVKLLDLKRGDFLIKSGQVERYTYLIESGAVAVKLFKENESHTIRFGYSGSFLNSIPSFFDDSPSLFDIIAIRKTRVRAFAKSRLFEVLDSDPKLKDAYISVLENLATQFVEREIDLLASSPAERYQRVLKRSPKLFEEIPLKHIAEYLRMSPETLSRLRKS